MARTKTIELTNDEVNAEPVVFHWTYKLDEIHEKEPEKIQLVNYYSMYQ